MPLRHSFTRNERGLELVEVGGVEPPSKTRRMAALHRLGPLLEPPGGERTSRSGRLPPWSRPSLGGVGKTQPVPPSGRPKPPVGRFNEPATWRSRVLARCLNGRGVWENPFTRILFRRRGPVRSYRWQFCLGGLMRGPADQPPPAPDTRDHDLSKPVTPVRPPGPASPGEG